jgi:hypothetical protein
MASRPSIETATFLSGFDYDPADLPDRLEVHSSGLLVEPYPSRENTMAAFVIRQTRASAGVGGDVKELFNGRLRPDGSRPSYQATEGHGLYFGNTPTAAAETPFIEGSNLHVLRVDTQEQRILDAQHAEIDPTATPEQKRAARSLRIRGIIPSFIGPELTLPGDRRTKAFDRLYGDTKDVIVYPPMALARPLTGIRNKYNGVRVPARWGIARGTAEELGQRIHIVGRRQKRS